MWSSVIRVAAAAALAALVGTSVAAAAPLRGRIYDAHAVGITGDLAAVQFNFVISRGGGRVRHLVVTDLSVPCGGNTVVDLAASPAGALIGPASTFRLRVATADSEHPGTPVGSLTITGSFAAAGAVAGRLRVRGAGPDSGCHLAARWRGHVRPLVEHFVGRAGPGARMGFYRTIERRPHVTDFAFNSLPARCPDGSVDLRTNDSVYSLAIHHRRFGASVFSTLGEYLGIRGRFTSAVAALGTVSYAGRDDCAFRNVSWTARRHGGPQVGPQNFS